MAKKSGLGGILGQAGMLGQLQSLQKNLLKTQEEVAAMTVTGTSGGGAVSAVVSGKRRVQSLTIQPDVIDPDDAEMLQDLIVAAINQGLEQVEKETEARMSEITGDLGLDLGVR